LEISHNLLWIGWKRKKHLNVDVRKKGSIFAKCIICESLKDLISKVGKNNLSVKEHGIKLKKHNIHGLSLNPKMRSSNKSCKEVPVVWMHWSMQTKLYVWSHCQGSCFFRWTIMWKTTRIVTCWCLFAC
jgi:hypothetical protein